MIMNKLKNYITYIPAVGILMVVASLPYHYGWLQRIGLYLSGIGYICDWLLNTRWREWKWTPDKWVYVAMVAFYACIPIRQLFDSNQTWLYLYKVREYVPFLILGIMGFCQMPTRLKTEHVAWTMLASCFYMGLVLVIGVWGHQADSFTDWLKDINKTRTLLINSHMSVNYYCNIALVFGTWVLLHSRCRRWAKIITGIVMSGVVLGLLLSEGRTGQLTMLVLLLMLGGIVMWQRYRRWLVPALSVLLLFCGSVWYFNPRYHEYSATDNPRLYIWRIGVETAKQKPLFGWGVSSARRQFVENGKADRDFCVHYMYEYERICLDRFGEVQYEIMHPHNAFLETMMELGIIGLALLLLCVGLPLCLLPIGKDKYYLAACMFVFVMQATFESFGRDLNVMWLPLMTLLWHYICLSRKVSK